MKLSSLIFAACILFVTLSFGANRSLQNGGPVKLVPVKDPQSGMVICKVPVPNSWNIGPESWTAPGNTTIQEFQGQMMPNAVAADEFIKSKLIPEMKTTGNRVLNVERYPFLEEFDKNYQSKLWKPFPTQNTFEVKGIEYEDNNGVKGIVILHVIQMKTSNGTMTQIFAQGMEGNRNYYEENKKALLYAVSNIQYNPQFIEAVNKMSQQQMAGAQGPGYGGR